MAVLVLLAASACGGSPEAPSAASPPPLDGTWLGYATRRPEVEWTLILAGNEYFLNGPRLWMKGTLKVDEAEAEIDLHIRECDCDDEGETALARYRLDENELLIAGLEPGSRERPVSADGGDSALAFRFTRFVDPDG